MSNSTLGMAYFYFEVTGSFSHQGKGKPCPYIGVVFVGATFAVALMGCSAAPSK